MPNQNRSYQWFFRVTKSHESLLADHSKNLLPLLPYVTIMHQWIDLKSCLAVLHKGDKNENEHAHFCITLTSELQKQSLDNRIKKLYNVSGANYSSKSWDGSDSALSYMFHEPEATIYINKGYTDDDIARYKELNAKVQAVVAINNARASGRQVDKILELIKESGGQWTPKEICAEFIRRVHTGEMYYCGDYQLKKYIEEVIIRQAETLEEVDAYINKKYHELYNT